MHILPDFYTTIHQILPRFRLLLLKFNFKVKLFKSTYEELVIQSKKHVFKNILRPKLILCFLIIFYNLKKYK